MLGLYYSDQKNFSFPFQVNAYCSRITVLYEKMEEIIRKGEAEKQYVIITERSILSDKEIFTKMLIKSGLFPLHLIQTYDMFWNMVAGRLSKYIKSVIFLDVNMDNITYRINKRSRQEETGDLSIPVDYLISLGDRYRKMEEEYQGKIPFQHIDWNLSYPHEVDTNDILEQVSETIKRTIY